MYYIGHKNPDTDSVCSAIAAAKIFGGTPLVAGEPKKETKFILDYFKVETPKIEKDFSNKKVFIVDYNQRTQHAEGMENAQITGILDHHALQEATITTEDPITVIIKPWGSTATLIADKAFSLGSHLDKTTAGLLASAIISDTIALTSPTTTEEDKKNLEKLLPIAEIADYMNYAKEMFKAKSDISELSAEEILTLDYKEFKFNGQKISFGVAETVSPEDLIYRKQDFIEAMKKIKQKSNLKYVFFAIVDVLKKQSKLIICDDGEKNLADKVFGGKEEKNIMDIGNRISRKKQMIPPISEYLNK